jgi:protein-disulfide isomerase
MTKWWIAAFVVQWVMVVALVFIVVALARQVGTLHLRLGPRGALEIDTEGPPLGEAPPPAPAMADSGHHVMVGGPGPRRVVAFSSPTCSVCREIAPALPAAASAARMAHVVLHDPEAERVWDVPGTPFVVVLDERGIVRAKGTINNLEQLEGLIDTATRRIDEEDTAA